MATQRIARRKDSKGVVLKQGEYQKGDKYEFRYVDCLGNKKSIYSKSLPKLREREKEIQENLNKGLIVSDITFGEAYEKMMEIKKITYKASTYDTYNRVYNNHIKGQLDNLYIVNIKKHHVQQFFVNKIKEYEFTSSMLNQIKKLLSNTFDWAVENQIIGNNPCSNIKEFINKIGKESKEIKALTVKEQKVFEQFLKIQPNRNMEYISTILLWTGLRVGELLALNWSDIDFNRKLISITKTMYQTKSGNLSLPEPKTKNSYRKVPMLPIVEKAFRDLKNYQKYSNITCCENVGSFKDFCFLTSNGKVIRQSAINKMLRRIIARSNKSSDVEIEKFSVHVFRHTFATRMIEKGIQPKVLQSLLGHSSITTTLNIYAECQDEFKVEEFFKVNEIIL